MEENVVASLWSLVADLGDNNMVMILGVAEIHPNDCVGSRSTASTERAFLIFLGMVIVTGDVNAADSYRHGWMEN